MFQRLERSPGVLWGFVFRDSAAARVTEQNFAEVLAPPRDWVWLHFARSDVRGRRFLESFEAASPEARGLLTGAETRLQIHLSAETAFGILPDIEKDFDDETLGTGRLCFWLDGAHLITARRHPMRVVDDIRCEVEEGKFLPAAPALVIERLCERFFEIVDARLIAMGSELDGAEDDVLSEDSDLERINLGPLRRELARYAREIMGLRTALQRAIAGRRAVEYADHPLTAVIGQILQLAEDFDHDVAALRERARLLHEEVDSRVANTTNRSLRALTIISTLMLPPTFLVGAFGMNVPAIPWANSHIGFWWAIGACIAIVAGCYYALRRARIL